MMGATPQIPVVGWNTTPALAPSTFEGTFFGAPPTTQPARFSMIPQPTQFVKRKIAQISSNYFSRICALLPVDFWCGLWYTIIVKGREVHTLWLCEIAGVDDLSCAGSKKNVKNPLTNRPSCDTIRVQKRESSKGYLFKSPIPWGGSHFPPSTSRKAQDPDSKGCRRKPREKTGGN
jgi:hypothetical protein